MIQRAKDTAIKIHKEVRKSTTKAILAAFAFIIALVWRDAIRSGIDAVIAAAGMEQTGYLYNLIAAIIITVICVFGILFFSRWKEEKEEAENKQ